MSQEPSLDIVGIGNAIVDVIAHAEDDFLVTHEISKGTMTLIDAERAEVLYDAMGPAGEYSGGSVANSMAGAAAFGARAAYIGKVHDDQLGAIFGHDIRAAGVEFDCLPANGGSPTARCFIMVTPDAHRTMCTYLGACRELGPDDVDTDLVASAKVTYLEGYLWDDENAKAAIRVAMAAARGAGRKVSLTLSDPFCVDRHRADFLRMVENDVDILFANEDEIVSLYQTATFDEAMARVREHCEVAALTRSEKGSVIVAGGETYVVEAETVDRVVDTTGAGDLYAAGFLWAYTQGGDLRACGRAGGIAAAEIISQVGARSDADLGVVMSSRMA